MGTLVWLATYLGLYFGVAEPAFQPTGFGEIFAAIVVICFVVANFAQGIFEGVTGR